MARKTIGQIESERNPGTNLKNKPGFKIDKNKIGLTGPTGGGTAKYTPPSTTYGETYISADARERGVGVTGSGNAKAGFTSGGQYRSPGESKDRGKGVVPPSRVQQKRSEAEAGVNMGGSRQTSARTQAPSGGAGKTGVTGSGGKGPSQDDGKQKDKKRDGGSAGAQTETQSSAGGNRGGGSSSGSSSSSTSTSAAGKKPGESKTVPAVPGTLNYFMKKAAASGDKNVKNRAYQMYKNYKDSKFPKGMNVDPSKIPANPKKGDAVKGKAGVTWTWNGQRWTRGKAAE